VFLPHSLLFCAADPPRCCRFSTECQRTLRYLCRASLDVFECALQSMRPADARISPYVCPTRGEHLASNMRTNRWRECAPLHPKPETWHEGTLTLLRQNAQAWTRFCVSWGSGQCSKFHSVCIRFVPSLHKVHKMNIMGLQCQRSHTYIPT